MNNFIQKYKLFLWVLMDSNHRSRKTADLQSAPFGHSGKHPSFVLRVQRYEKDVIWKKDEVRK